MKKFFCKMVLIVLTLLSAACVLCGCVVLTEEKQSTGGISTSEENHEPTEPVGKTFEKAGLSIVLTEEFNELPTVEYTASYSSPKILITTLKETFFYLPNNKHGKELTEKEYTGYLKVKDKFNTYKTEVLTENGLTYIVYDYAEEEKQYTAILSVYKAVDSFWSVRLFCESAQYGDLEEAMFQYARSVVVEKYVEDTHNGTAGLRYEKFTDKEEYYVSSIGTAYGNVIIASECNGLPVTSVGTAFKDCEQIASLTIPNSIKSIGAYAFQGSYLSSVTFSDSLISIGSYAFYECYALTNITIPNSVTSIGYSAFSGCSRLASITFSNALTKIEGSTFYGCKALTNIVIPNSVTSIADSAFSGCSGLTSITIPNSVTSIGSSAFSGCKELTSITIPNAVTSIDSFLFSGCKKLTSITIPNSITFIGSFSFSGCSGLTNIVIPNSVISIGSSSFSGCSGLTNIAIPNSVISIGDSAFVQCSGLTEVILSDSLTSIGIGAFANCTALTNITIPDSVTCIDYSVFNSCIGLESIIIPNSVTYIGSWAFTECNSLTSVYYKGTAEEWESMNGSELVLSASQNGTVYCYSENEPPLNGEGTAYDGNYWRYGNNGEIVIWTKETV